MRRPGLVQRGVGLDADDVGPRRHDLAGVGLGEPQDPLDHVAAAAVQDAFAFALGRRRSGFPPRWARPSAAPRGARQPPDECRPAAPPAAPPAGRPRGRPGRPAACAARTPSAAYRAQAIGMADAEDRAEDGRRHRAHQQSRARPGRTARGPEEQAGRQRHQAQRVEEAHGAEEIVVVAEEAAEVLECGRGASGLLRGGREKGPEGSSA